MLGLGTSVVPDSSATSFFLEATLLAKFKTRVIDDGGSVESYSCMEQQLVPLLLEPTTFTTGLLEFYPNAAAAYSLRQLRRSVSPYAIRVRRANDLEQDIGFNSNGELDTNALLDFADGGDAWVTTWYDQSSNGNDATQGTPSSQPQIVSSGVVVTENGKPALEFNGVSSYMDAADVTTTQPTTVSLVLAIDIDARYFFDGDDATDRQASFISSGVYSAFAGSTQGSGVVPTVGDQIHKFILFDNLNGQIYVNNVGNSSLAMGSNVLSGLDIGQRYNGASRLYGRFQELIFWNADHSDSRTTIQNNVNDFYSIYS